MSPEVIHILRLACPAGLAIIGLSMLLRPSQWRAKRTAAHDRALEERLKRGHDRYFEELRTLQSYPSAPGSRAARILGAVIVALAIVQIILIARS